jgi:Mn2+/Fe2+ NRAMP family transporter
MRLQVRGRFRPRRSRIVIFLGLLGPGLIAANAGNDAGGIATYSEVGAKYGYTLLWAMLLITVSLALVQRSACWSPTSASASPTSSASAPRSAWPGSRCRSRFRSPGSPSGW